MYIRSEQLNPVVGDLEGNLKKILFAIDRAKEDQIDLLVLPELVVCGYPPMDLLERKAFLDRCESATAKIIETSNGITVVFGAPVKNKIKVGRPLFNAAIVASDGKQIAEVYKTLLPNYDVFDEFRYFEPNDRHEPVEINGVKLGITVCEDIWRNENEIVYHTYEIDPAELLVKKGAEILINISASPYSRNKPELRRDMLLAHADRFKKPIIYANQVGANTELIFDGDSMILNRQVEVIERTELFREDFVDARYEAETKDLVPVKGRKPSQMPQEERFFEAIKLGLSDYMRKSGLGTKVILGLSGGIDSALTAVIAKEALGAENVLTVTMPSAFSSAGSVSDSEKLAKNLGLTLHELPIGKIYDNFLEALQPLFKNTAFNVAEENLQSRSRGVLLMAISNKFGHVLLNTGNKSEMAVGYCTLYGDMAGGLSVLADLYKTEVYAVSRWLNDTYYQKEMIPEDIITKPPSAELRPDQKDTDSLPDYHILDSILRSYIEDQQSPDEIAGTGVDPKLVKRVTTMVDRNEYKRRQAAPGLRVSSKAFGVGRRLPIVQGWTPQQ